MTADNDGISIPASSSLQELYISGTSCAFVDAAACSLTSFGIIHKGPWPLLTLPASLEKLYLYNALAADAGTMLSCLSDLRYLQLGGRAASKGNIKHVPQLSPSLLELDLWDGIVTKFEHLTLLTNLKKLRMPMPPTLQQLAIIKQLRQLRNIEVTSHQGMQ